MSRKETSYGTIFKTTFLFGFVQVFRIIVGVVKNKIVAILLGTEGVGLLGVYSSATSPFKSTIHKSNSSNTLVFS